MFIKLYSKHNLQPSLQPHHLTFLGATRISWGSTCTTTPHKDLLNRLLRSHNTKWYQWTAGTIFLETTAPSSAARLGRFTFALGRIRRRRSTFALALGLGRFRRFAFALRLRWCRWFVLSWHTIQRRLTNAIGYRIHEFSEHNLIDVVNGIAPV